MDQDQQAQLITHQGHLKVPMEKMYCLPFQAQRASSALTACSTTSHSPGLTSCFSWDLHQLRTIASFCRGGFWVMTGPWKPSPAMGQSIWDPYLEQIWVATHTARLSPSPVLTELSSNDTAQAHHSLFRKEHSASLPVPWSTPKLTVTLPGNEITAVHNIRIIRRWASLLCYENFYRR